MTNTLIFVAAITKREVPQPSDMLMAFKDRVKQKKGGAGTEAPQTEARAGSSSKKSKEEDEEGRQHRPNLSFS